jgi:serine/threonine protein kinase
MHSKAIAHRDLKPENILLDSDLNIKIADFGLSGYIDEEGQMATIVGTNSYKAPEVHRAETSYDGEKVDWFAAGIVLFIMVAGHFPFIKAVPGDAYYKFIIENQGDLYFKKVFKNRPEDFFSKDLKDLILNMLNPDPEFRFNGAEVTNHNWSKGEVMDKEEIETILKKHLQKEKERTNAAKQQFKDEKKKTEAKQKAHKEAKHGKLQNLKFSYEWKKNLQSYWRY